MGRNSSFVTSYSYVDYLRTLQTTEEIYRSNLGKPTLYFILISVITSYDILRQRPVGFSYQNPSVPPVQQFIVHVDVII